MRSFAELASGGFDDAVSDVFHGPNGLLGAMQSLEAQVTCHLGCVRREAERENVLVQKGGIAVGVWVALSSCEPSAFSQSPALDGLSRLVQEHKPFIVESRDRLPPLVEQDFSVNCRAPVLPCYAVFLGRVA